MIFFLLFISYIDGYLQRLVNIKDGYSLNVLYYTITLLGTITSFKFAQNYLQTKLYAPKTNHLITIGTSIFTLGYILSWFDGQTIVVAQFLIMGNNILLSIVYLVGAVKAKKQSYQPANFILYPFIASIIFSNLYLLQYLGYIPGNSISQNGIHIGYSILGILITLGLLVRYKLLLEQQNQDEIKNKVALELLIEERTRSLSLNIRELAEANIIITKQKNKIEGLNSNLTQKLECMDNKQ
jgi:hypothetical protein